MWNLTFFFQREEAKWHSELKNLQDSQREEFRTWIQQIRDDMENGTEGPVSRRIRAMSDLLPPTRREVIVEEPKLEESFTIHLGNWKQKNSRLKLRISFYLVKINKTICLKRYLTTSFTCFHVQVPKWRRCTTYVWCPETSWICVNTSPTEMGECYYFLVNECFTRF